MDHPGSFQSETGVQLLCVCVAGVQTTIYICQDHPRDRWANAEGVRAGSIFTASRGIKIAAIISGNIFFITSILKLVEVGVNRIGYYILSWPTTSGQVAEQAK